LGDDYDCKDKLIKVEDDTKQLFRQVLKLAFNLSMSDMICFDFEAKIKKCSSPEEVVKSLHSMYLVYFN